MEFIRTKISDPKIPTSNLRRPNRPLSIDKCFTNNPISRFYPILKNSYVIFSQNKADEERHKVLINEFVTEEKDPELEQSSKELLDLYKEFNIESFDADVEENSEEDIE